MNKKREMFLKASNGDDIYINIWEDVNNPKGIVQIFHGMVEHIGRYDEFAKFLNINGYVVVGDDHRGHGNTSSPEGLGYLGHDGFNRIVQDEKEISDFIKGEYGGLPLYILGHSFGSFIAQEYLIRYSNEIDGIIFSGSAKQDGIDIKAGKLVACIQKMLFDDRKKARLIDKLAFGGYNKNIKNPKSKFDWLSRDEREVELYANDKFCAFVPSINFYYNLFNGLCKLYKEDRLKEIRKDIDILVMSGDKDPVGKNGKSVKRLYEQYKRLGIKNTSIKLYEEGRHEMLNELNKEEVYVFIEKWIDYINSR
ncbi:MAG: lysophospholipase [Clostridium sp.]